jgi:porin
MTISKSLIVSCLSVLSLLFYSTAQAASAFDPNGQWMLGDWNGQRTALQAQGMIFLLIYR